MSPKVSSYSPLFPKRLGFGVWGFGFAVYRLGFKVWGSGVGVQGFGVWGGCWLQ